MSSEEQIRLMLSKRPRVLLQFNPKIGQEDVYKMYLHFVNSDKYTEMTMASLLSKVDGLSDWLNMKNKIIFENNNNFYRACELYSRTRDVRLVPVMDDFRRSFRGGPFHAYQIAFDNMTDKILPQYKREMSTAEAGVDF